MPNTLTEAISQLEGIKRQLIDQLQATDQAIGALRVITDGAWPNVEIEGAPAAVAVMQSVPGSAPPSVVTPPPAPPAAPAPLPASAPLASTGNVKGDQLRSRICDALKFGPLAPRQLLDKLGVRKLTLRRAIEQLEAEGVVKSSGTTAARRIALTGRPAKEVP